MVHKTCELLKDNKILKLSILQVRRREILFVHRRLRRDTQANHLQVPQQLQHPHRCRSARVCVPQTTKMGRSRTISDPDAAGSKRWFDCAGI